MSNRFDEPPLPCDPVEGGELGSAAALGLSLMGAPCELRAGAPPALAAPPIILPPPGAAFEPLPPAELCESPLVGVAAPVFGEGSAPSWAEYPDPLAVCAGDLSAEPVLVEVFPALSWPLPPLACLRY